MPLGHWREHSGHAHDQRVTRRSKARPSPKKATSVLRVVFGPPQLRRVELAFAAFCAARWAVSIALLVYAFERSGTTTASLIAAALLSAGREGSVSPAAGHS